ncbi:gluconate transporter [Elizabethkingia meningoseptica]|uniref:GntP family permease n=1 Tax=Elizabethkingia meningoseptica TaxID=238 RepID=UPI000332C26B|nr:gluconate:H+ symporter [Elizabethkingia meningoseptica]AQX06723.1 gluconate transporter [Elizabethkingia meningoseptica]AQX48771.1 gluconate transporter [Elizabethkingia meningoseptica]EOR28874.1 gluconate transporter [Elizabethkingia meningoseptica ATCC 13253 = NBRC 12535]KUY14856.1 gluconate transporter [Elizabethkingia meningoseptica]OPB69773.1 gluconate transporter [Elizabethkingia meningoseptica]
MSVLILLLCIIVLILQIVRFKINPFIAFITTSLLAGIALGIPVDTLAATIQKGFGDMLGSITLIIIFGTCIGKLTVSSGAASVIAETVMKWTGEKYVRLGLLITGFIVGIPLFYSVGFILLVPLIFSVGYQFKLPKVYIAIPMLASLSVAHGFLPPHPSPMALNSMLHADIGAVLMYGVVIAIPTLLIAGLLFSNTLKNIRTNDTGALGFTENELEYPKVRPGFTVSIISSLFPVFGLTITTLLPLVWKDEYVNLVCKTIGEPSIIMLLSLIICTYTLGFRVGKNMKAVMEDFTSAIKDVILIILIIGGAGSLKEVMMVSGVSQTIVNSLMQINIHPYLLAWLMAALVRICIGSATAAGLMTAGVLLPLLQLGGLDPNLLVLSIGAGSLMCSHVNDPGFWLFKEYFGTSMKDTVKSWTVMESLVSVLGIAFIFILNTIIH